MLLHQYYDEAQELVVVQEGVVGAAGGGLLAKQLQ